MASAWKIWEIGSSNNLILSWVVWNVFNTKNCIIYTLSLISINNCLHIDIYAVLCITPTWVLNELATQNPNMKWMSYHDTKWTIHLDVTHHYPPLCRDQCGGFWRKGQDVFYQWNQHLNLVRCWDWWGKQQGGTNMGKADRNFVSGLGME